MDSDSVRVPPLRPGGYDPADYAGAVVRSAEQAGVSPRLVMGVLYNEAYKPHHPLLERLWQWWKPEASFGVANMHRAAFEQVRRVHGLSGRWQDLRDDPAFAIRVAALHLKDLDGRLPACHVRRYTREELLALGYNAGERNMRAFARGVPRAPWRGPICAVSAPVGGAPPKPWQAACESRRVLPSPRRLIPDALTRIIVSSTAARRPTSGMTEVRRRYVIRMIRFRGAPLRCRTWTFDRWRRVEVVLPVLATTHITQPEGAAESRRRCVRGTARTRWSCREECAGCPTPG